MERLLFSHTQPIVGVILSIVGFEIDGEEAYQEQITEWTDIFVDLLKDQIGLILANKEIMEKALKGLASLGFWGYVVMAIAITFTLAIDLIMALWAPADLIIQDTLSLSTSDLARMTSLNMPPPDEDPDTGLYTTAGNIEVRLMSVDKAQYEYTEVRGYVSDDEDSWYNLKLRYNRTV